MTLLIILLTILPLLFVSRTADSADFASSRPDVLTLNEHNFDKVTKKRWVFVKFHVPWCKHCQAMEEEFNSAASAVKGKTVLPDVKNSVEGDLA